jgi:hypothetical protein
MSDIETIEDASEDISFGKEIAKTLILSTAATAGTLIGFAAIGLAVDKYQKRKMAKKAASEETPTDEN